MESDDRPSDDVTGLDKQNNGRSARRIWLRVALVTVTMLAVLTLIVIGVVRIVQS